MLRTTRPAIGFKMPMAALLLVGVACMPISVNFLLRQTTSFQGLDWIEPPTWSRVVDMPARLSFGYLWLFGALLPGVLALMVRSRARTADRATNDKRPKSDAPQLESLMLLWIAFAWLGLVAISWLHHPLLVDRYALPASAPMLLIPVLMVDRLYVHAAKWATALVVIVGVGHTATQDCLEELGFRELVAFVHAEVDPTSEAVVLMIDPQPDESWITAETLPFKYYPLNPGFTLHDCTVPISPGDAACPDVLSDPRPLWIVVFRTDPFPILERAQRSSISIRVTGSSFSQLVFSPYRLVRVCAK
jgi:hypothetical protein